MKFLAIALCFLTLSVGAQSMRPLTEEEKKLADIRWTTMVAPSRDTVLGIDPTSFVSVKQKDIFTFKFILMIRPGTAMEGGVPLSAIVGTMRASCVTRMSQIIEDVYITDPGYIFKRNVAASEDKPTLAEEGSLPHLVMSRICNGQHPTHPPTNGGRSAPNSSNIEMIGGSRESRS